MEKKRSVGVIRIIGCYETLFALCVFYEAYSILYIVRITHSVQYMTVPILILFGILALSSGILTLMLKNIGRWMSIIFAIVVGCLTAPYFSQNTRIAFSSLKIWESPFQLTMAGITLFSIFTILYLVHPKVKEQFKKEAISRDKRGHTSFVN